MLQVVFILWMKVLVIEIVEELHQAFQKFGLSSSCRVGYNSLKYDHSEIFQEIVNLITDLDDFLIERITAGKISVFVSDVLD